MASDVLMFHSAATHTLAPVLHKALYRICDRVTLTFDRLTLKATYDIMHA